MVDAGGRGDVGDVPDQFGCDALVEGGEAQARGLVGVDALDGGGGQLDLDLQGASGGDDGGEDLCGGDDAADGMDVQFVDDAVDGRAHVGAAEAVGNREGALAQFGETGGDGAKFTLRLDAGGVVDGEDLQADLAGARGGAGDGGLDLAEFAGDADLLALDGVEPACLDQLAVGQIARAVVFGGDERGVGGLGIALAAHAGDFLVNLRNAEFKLLALAVAALALTVEQAGLARDQGRGLGVGLHPVRREGEGGQAVAFGGQSCAADLEFGDLAVDDGLLGGGLGIVEPHQQLALTDSVAFAHGDGGDDAAVAVLDCLDVVLDDHGALGDDGPAEFGGEDPAADAADQGTGEQQAADHARPEPQAAAVVVLRGEGCGGGGEGHGHVGVLARLRWYRRRSGRGGRAG